MSGGNQPSLQVNFLITLQGNAKNLPVKYPLNYNYVLSHKAVSVHSNCSLKIL